MRRALCAVMLSVALGWTGAAPAADTLPDDPRLLKAMVKMLQASLKSRDAEIARLKKQVADLQAALPAPKPPPAAKPDAAAEPAPPAPTGPLRAPLTVGKRGLVGKVSVFKVLSKTEALVDLAVGGTTTYNVTIGDRTLKKTMPKTQRVFLSGLDTAGMRPRQSYTVNKPLVVAGTKEYRSLTGKRKTVVLKPLTATE